MELASPLPAQPPWLMATRGHLLKWQDCRLCGAGVAITCPPAMAPQPLELWVDSVSQPWGTCHRHLSAQSKTLLAAGGLREKTLVPSPALGAIALGAVHDGEGSLGVCRRTRSCPAFTQGHRHFSCIHSLSPSFHSHEFLWSLLREGGKLEVERRVGEELIRMGDSKSKHRLFKEAVFTSHGRIALSEMCHGIPKRVSCSDDFRSCLLVCWLIFHSVSFLLLQKKSAINKMYFCNFHVYIWYISTNGQLL